MLVIKQCENCGCDVEIRHKKRLESKHTFCSQKCKGEYQKSNSEKNCTCCVCGKKFHLKPYHLNKYPTHTCSPECTTKIRSERMTGENNHQYGLRGELNPTWKSNEKISTYGYRLIRRPNHPYCNTDGFVFEHRLVAEQYLLNDENSIEIDGEKYLSPMYVVHHLDFDRLNNDVSNLFIVTKDLHSEFHNSLTIPIRDELGRFVTFTRPEESYTKQELKNLFLKFIKDNEIN